MATHYIDAIERMNLNIFIRTLFLHVEGQFWISVVAIIHLGTPTSEKLYSTNKRRTNGMSS